jgi:Protein of unknown function (DUF2442)
MLAPKVQQVKALPDYCLDLQFETGATGLLNIKPYLDFGIFSRLRDPEAFAKVSIAFDTVQWDCGVDLDPAFVYQKSRMKLHA